MAGTNPRRLRNFSLPTDNELQELQEMMDKEKVEAEKEEGAPWQHFVSDSDRSTPGTLFSNPPEKFIAKLSYDQLVYCWLLEDNDEHGYLCYLLNASSYWTTVYVYKGICAHQAHMIVSVYGINHVDWRVVPITNRNSKDEFSRKNGLDWGAWIFHHYFGFDPFTEPD